VGTQRVLWLEMAVVVLNSSTKSTETYLQRRGLIKKLDDSEGAAVGEWEADQGTGFTRYGMLLGGMNHIGNGILVPLARLIAATWTSCREQCAALEAEAKTCSRTTILFHRISA
jgi:hypothetical protein